MIESKSPKDYILKFMLYTVLSAIALLCIIPFVHVIAASLSSPEYLSSAGFILWPIKPNLDTYRYIFSTKTVFQGLYNTVYITVAGTIVNMIMTILMAYPLAHSYLPGRRVINFLVVFTMMFTGGMIPNYIIVKDLGLIDSYWSVILPGAINAFNLIVLRNFFSQIPGSMEESARIDGCSEFRILVSIILPLSMASLATLTLFYAVAHWNQFQQPLMFLNDSTKWPIQILLRQMVVLASGAGLGDSGAMEDTFTVPQQSVRMAVIVVSTVPILIVYPFLQKYFAEGVMVGSVKG